MTRQEIRRKESMIFTGSPKNVGLKMESLHAHCLDHQAVNMTPPSTHCDLPDGRLLRIDTCMENELNMRGKPTARRTQPSLPVSQALAPCARQSGFRARRQAVLFAPKSTVTLHESRHALGEPLHISILAAHYAPV